MAAAASAAADPFAPARVAAIEAVNADSAGQQDKAVHAYETAAHLIRTVASSLAAQSKHVPQDMLTAAHNYAARASALRSAAAASTHPPGATVAVAGGSNLGSTKSEPPAATGPRASTSGGWLSWMWSSPTSGDASAGSSASASSTRVSSDKPHPRPAPVGSATAAGSTRTGPSPGETTPRSVSASALGYPYSAHTAGGHRPAYAGHTYTPAPVAAPAPAPASASSASATASSASATASSASATASSASTTAPAMTALELRVLEDTVVMPPATAPAPGSELAKIAGLRLAKTILVEAVIEPMLNPDVYTGLRAPPRGILLFGPPGTGKTLLARAVSREAKACFFSVSASSLTSKWVGEGEKQVKALFNVARRYAPSIIFVDEIDSLLSRRGSGDSEASMRIKTEFLVQMDGVTTGEGDRVLLMGATNRPQELDDAIIRRFQRRVLIPLPDEAGRKALLSILTQGETLSMNKKEAAALARITDGYSGSDLKALCQEAAQGPVRELRARLGHGVPMRKQDLPPLRKKHFVEAMRIVRPSVPPSSLAAFSEWASTFAATS